MSRGKILFLLVLFGACFYLFTRENEVPFIPFDVAMSKASPHFEKCYTAPKKSSAQWKLTKKLYEKNLSKAPSVKTRIPKIIHQIWLGGELPAKYRRLQKSWKEHHPDWEYRLWTDADLPTFPFVNRERFEKAVNIGERADILRYEILNRYGGLYVDTDFECVRPFDVFHSYCDFYAGIEAAPLEDNEVCLGNALIGTVPHHPIIACCLQRIAEKPPGKNASEVHEISGPGCLKRAFFKCCQEGSYRNVAFPYTFFYPIPSSERDNQLGEVAKSEWIQPESFGIHYWEASWNWGY